MTDRPRAGKSDKGRRPRYIRPRERQRMRPWLIEHLEKNDIPGLAWVSREEKSFSIAWKHASSQYFNMQKDTNLFERWAIHTGRHYDRHHKRWKANFRCALNSLPDVMEDKEQGIKKGNNAFKVYEFLDEKDIKQIKDAKGCKKKGEKAYLHNRTDPSWLPTLHLPNPTPTLPTPSPNCAIGRYERASQRQRQKQLSDTLDETNKKSTAEINQNKKSNNSNQSGKKADLYDQDNPDWCPTLHLGPTHDPDKPPAGGTKRGYFRKSCRAKQSESQGKSGGEMVGSNPSTDESAMGTGAGPEPLAAYTVHIDTLKCLKYVKTETGGRQCIKCLHEFSQLEEFDAHVPVCFSEYYSHLQGSFVDETIKSEPKEGPDGDNAGADNRQTSRFVAMNAEIKQEPDLDNQASHYSDEFEAVEECSEDFSATGEFHIEQNFVESDCVNDNPDNSMYSLDDMGIQVVVNEPDIGDPESSMHDLDEFDIKVEVDKDGGTDDMHEGSESRLAATSGEGNIGNVSSTHIKVETITVAAAGSDESTGADHCEVKVEVSAEAANNSDKSDEETTGSGLTSGDGTVDYASDCEMETNFDINSYASPALPNIADTNCDTDSGSEEFPGADSKLMPNNFETRVAADKNLQITGVFCNEQILNKKWEGTKTKSLTFACPRCGVLFNSHGALKTHACLIRLSQMVAKSGVSYTCEACHEAFPTELDQIEHEMVCGLKQSEMEIEWAYPKPMKETIDGSKGTETATPSGVYQLGSDIKWVYPKQRNEAIERNIGTVTATPSLQATCSDGEEALPQGAKNIISRLRPLLPRKSYYDCFFAGCGAFFSITQLAEYRKHLETELMNSLQVDNTYKNGLTLHVLQTRLMVRDLKWPIMTCNQPHCQFMCFTVVGMKSHFQNTHSCIKCKKVCKNKHQLTCHGVIAHQLHMKQQGWVSIVQKNCSNQTPEHVFVVNNKKRRKEVSSTVEADANTDKSSNGGPSTAVERDVISDKSSNSGRATAVERDVISDKSSNSGPSTAVERDVNSDKSSKDGLATAVKRDTNSDKSRKDGLAPAVKRDVNTDKSSDSGPSTAVKRDVNSDKSSKGGPAVETFSKSDQTEKYKIDSSKTVKSLLKQRLDFNSYIANLIEANEVKLSSPQVDALKHKTFKDLSDSIGGKKETVLKDDNKKSVRKRKICDVDDETEKSFNDVSDSVEGKEKTSLKSGSKKSSRKKKIKIIPERKDKSQRLEYENRKESGTQSDGDDMDVDEGSEPLTVETKVCEGDQQCSVESGTTNTEDGIMKDDLHAVRLDEENIPNYVEKEGMNSVESDTSSVTDTTQGTGFNFLESYSTTVQDKPDDEVLNSMETNLINHPDTSGADEWHETELNAISPHMLTCPQIFTVQNPVLDLEAEIDQFPDDTENKEHEEMLEVACVGEKDTVIAATSDINTSPNVSVKEQVDITDNTTPVKFELNVSDNHIANDVTNVETNVEMMDSLELANDCIKRASDKLKSLGVNTLKMINYDDDAICSLTNHQSQFTQNENVQAVGVSLTDNTDNVSPLEITSTLSEMDDSFGFASFQCQNASCTSPAFWTSKELKKHIEEAHMQTSISGCNKPELPEKVEASFQCQIASCTAPAFWTWEEFKKHIEEVHSGCNKPELPEEVEASFQCQNASCTAPAFWTSEELKKHIEEAHMQTSITCPISGCNKQFAKVSGLVQHQMTFHVNRLSEQELEKHAQFRAAQFWAGAVRNTQACMSGGTGKGPKSAIISSIVRNASTGQQDASVGIIPGGGGTVAGVDGEVSAADNDTTEGDKTTISAMFMCSVCSQVLADSDQLKHHMTEHMHSCHLCPLLFKSYHELQNHLDDEHSVLPFRCQCCSKSFRTKSGVLKHVQSTHWELDTEALPYKCTKENCSKAFLFEKELFAHVKSHGMVPGRKRNFKCRVKDCNRMFPTKNDLFEHVQSHNSYRSIDGKK